MAVQELERQCLQRCHPILMVEISLKGVCLSAQALAKSCGCFFMSVSVSSIQSKWYGDAQKLVRAIFTLAEKLQPCIVFIGWILCCNVNADAAFSVQMKWIPS